MCNFWLNIFRRDKYFAGYTLAAVLKRMCVGTVRVKYLLYLTDLQQNWNRHLPTKFVKPGDYYLLVYGSV
jgi:hypothetical protein